MSIIEQKYLRDENGEIFSPIADWSSIIAENDLGETLPLKDLLSHKFKVLFNGQSTSSSYEWNMVALNDNYNNYDIIIALIGVSQYELSVAVLPTYKHIPFPYQAFWRCQALLPDYIAGGEICLVANNLNLLSWRIKYIKDWDTIRLFFVLGIKI